jgi:hypothetical protein
MRRLRALVCRLGGWFNRHRRDRELDAEIESHLQLHIADNVRLGMTPEEARREALIKLGGIEATKEAYRDQRGLPGLETLWQDVRHGGRMLRKNPGFTAVAVLTLGLGIGGSTGVFSLINGVVLRPLPYLDAERLVLIWTESQASSNERSAYASFAVIRQGMKTVGIGVSFGIVLSLGITRLMQRLLYDVKPTDPLMFASVSFLLVGIALLACWLPARRAMQVDPMHALREE